MRRSSFVAGIAAAFTLGAGAAAADPVADFYKDKKINFVIGTAPGGTYDAWARLMARHWGAHIPGHPGFISKNMPGAGGIMASNYIFNIAPKDGTVIATFSRNIPTRAVLNHPAVKFDPIKFGWLGSPELTNRVCVALASSKVKTGTDLFEHELLMGGAGAGTAVSTTPNVLRTLLGMKMKLIEGYKSATDVVLAMERGEVQGICQTYTAFKVGHPGWIESGKVNVLFNIEPNPIPNTKIPSVFNFVKTKEQREILSFYSSNVELGRPVTAPPGLPADRLTALRRSFDALMKDPKFVEGAKKQGLEIDPLTGEEVAKRVTALANTPADIVTKTEAMLAKLNPEFTETVKVTGVKRKGRNIAFKGKKGAMEVSVSKSSTKVSIGGKKAKRSAIKVGMTCTITHLGPNSRAKKIACK